MNVLNLSTLLPATQRSVQGSHLPLHLILDIAVDVMSEKETLVLNHKH